MTRSPLRSSNRESQRNANAIKSTGADQRERLTREVRERQQLETRNGSSSTSDARATIDPVPVQMPVVATLTPEQMYSNFEEWIKMATDNKINAHNSWNFALIDYFHEMTFIRDGDSINFQKASCTLDGCVKIYTSRVDSVASETGKLLSGLADSSRDKAGSNDDDDDEGNRDGSEKRARRRGNRAESTLLKDFSSIALKKFDLDFAVDPLFKKTSSDFDEGGARGLLLNHLNIDRECKLIFDASDASNAEAEIEHADIPEDVEERVQDDEADEGEEGEEQQQQQTEDNEANNTEVLDNPMEGIESNEQEEKPAKKDNTATTATSGLVEISRLKAKLPTFDVFSSLQICPTLHGYNFFSENDNALPKLDHSDHDIQPPEDNNINLDVPNDYGDPNDDFGDLGDFGDFDFDNNGPEIDAIDNAPILHDEDADKEADVVDGQLPLHEEDYLTALANGQGDDLFSYFDSAFTKNWAGPEHWKLRRPVSKEKSTTSAQPNEDGDEERPKRNKKPAFQIDFLDGEQVDENELFATDKRVKITMSATKDSSTKPNLHLLPDDMHFSSKQLLRFFLKPDFMIHRKRPQKTASDPIHEEPEAYDSAAPQPDYDTGFDPGFDFEPDAQYWANQDTQQIQDNNGFETADTPAVDQTILTAYDDNSLYQDTFYDTYDDPESSQYGDPLITSHRLKKTKPLYVNYARRAKRVDVKRLKDNLWKALTKTQENQNANGDSVQGEKRFSDIIQNLRPMYSEKAMKDISISFCFICLLHLANERGLVVHRKSANNEDDDDDDDFVLGDGNNFLDENFLKNVVIVQNS